MESVRVTVDSIQSAACVLGVVLQDARSSRKFYEFGPINAQEVLDSGLRLDGDVGDLLRVVLETPGAYLA